MTLALLQLAAFLGVSWAVARGVDWVYRGNEPAEQPDDRPVGVVLTRS